MAPGSLELDPELSAALTVLARLPHVTASERQPWIKQAATRVRRRLLRTHPMQKPVTERLTLADPCWLERFRTRPPTLHHPGPARLAASQFYNGPLPQVPDSDGLLLALPYLGGRGPGDRSVAVCRLSITDDHARSVNADARSGCRRKTGLFGRVGIASVFQAGRSCAEIVATGARSDERPVRRRSRYSRGGRPRRAFRLRGARLDRAGTVSMRPTLMRRSVFFAGLLQVHEGVPLVRSASGTFVERLSRARTLMGGD
jgi:hypothetical protein